MAKSKMRVLVVDDAMYARNRIKNVVNKTTFARVIGEATNGNEAIKLFKSLKPDLITMDLVMAEKGGIEAVGEIMRLNRNAIIIVITAIGQESIIFEAMMKGAKEYIQKPFDNNELLSVLKRHLKIIKK